MWSPSVRNCLPLETVKLTMSQSNSAISCRSSFWLWWDKLKWQPACFVVYGLLRLHKNYARRVCAWPYAVRVDACQLFLAYGNSAGWHVPISGWRHWDVDTCYWQCVFAWTIVSYSNFLLRDQIILTFVTALQIFLGSSGKNGRMLLVLAIFECIHL